MDIYIKDDGGVDVLNISPSEAIVLLKSLKGRYTTIQKIIETSNEDRAEFTEISKRVFDVKHDVIGNYSTNELASIFASEYSLLYDILHKSGVKL